MNWLRERRTLPQIAAAGLAVGVTALVLIIPIFEWDKVESAEFAVRYALPLVPIWALALLLFLRRNDRNVHPPSRGLDMAENRLLDAIEGVGEGIALYDAEERFVACNTKYKEMRKAIADLLVPGALFEDILRASAERRLGILKGVDNTNVNEWLRQRLQRFRNPGSPEVRAHSDGRWEEIRCFRTQSGDRIIIRSDITERKEAEIAKILSRELEERKRAETDLREAKRAAELANREKSRFLANISHEFRTPLNAIIGFADVLRQQYFGPLGDERYREYTDYICTSGEHLLALVNDLLDLSVIEAGQQALNRENMTPEDIVADSIRIFGVRADFAAVKLEVRIPENLPPIQADRRLVKQVLLNLLSNAVKFTPKGGRITVSAEAENGFTELRVTDTGRGIPSEKLAEVTSPFQKGEGDPYLAEKGWGLGLAISKSIVELHDGALEIESRVGEGTTVSVKLPSAVN